MLQVSAWISKAVINGEMEEALSSIILHANKQLRLMVVHLGFYSNWALLNAIHPGVFSY